MSSKWLRDNQGLFFMAPAMALFFVFVLYSIFYILAASLYDWDGINEAVFVGLGNYIELFTDDRTFGLTLRNSFLWTFLTIFPQMLLGFLLAFILTSGIPFQNIFRIIFFTPAIISPVVLGIVWQRIYNPFGGLLADIGIEIGLSFLRQPYLADPKIAIYSTIAVNVWQWTGFSMLMYVAGLQSLSQEVLQAAEVDGAAKWQQIRFVIWPMLRHVHLTLILLGVIGTLQTFALVFMLTKGGPNHATEMLPTYIFQRAFTLQSMGYASALAVVLLVIALGASIFQVSALGSRFTLGS